MRHAEDSQFFDLLVDSYRRLIGVEPAFLVPGADAHWLYAQAPVCVLAHNTESDPRFIYANKTAQDVFEYSWDEFVALPSRLSAEAPEREERQRLLDAVAWDGFAAGHSGIRIAKSGRRFWIEDCTLWQLRDKDARLHGVAAWFARWRDA
ncbi:MAG: MEKHLA domain-containing protein [Alphaproteobacteria bacterium]